RKRTRGGFPLHADVDQFERRQSPRCDRHRVQGRGQPHEERLSALPDEPAVARTRRAADRSRHSPPRMATPDSVTGGEKLVKTHHFFRVGLVALMIPTVPAAPPFSGTIFIDPDIITAADPTTFTNITYIGQGIRNMYDRRSNSFNNINAFL